MTNDKSLNQFYQNFMEEVLVASDMETSGWMIDDFLTSIILEYLEEAGEVTDPIMCPFRSYGLQLNAYSISEDYSSLDLFVCVYSNNKIPRSVSQTDIDVAIKRAIQLYQKATMIYMHHLKKTMIHTNLLLLLTNIKQRLRL